MANLGTATLGIALVLTIYAMTASFVGIRSGKPALTMSGQRATYLVTLTLAVSVAALVIAFLQHDFSIVYVAQHSNLAMPKIYTWVAFYSGNQGSLLYIAFALSAISSISMVLVTRRLGPQRPYANGVLMLILTFFVAVVLFMANPFVQSAVAPADGQGINPLLAHPGMFIHPPMIMLGLSSIAVPFALAMGGLLSGRLNDDWVDTGRIWGIVAWALLGIGLLLGAWWAYTILGWGGYWGWDPVEDAALMPWLALTAFIHSIMVQKRRGMFRMWNIALINISFALAAFGMFINRGGPVPSVHSFGQSNIGWLFLTFLAVVAVSSFGLFFYRLRMLRAPARLESMFSREAAFLVNNLLLLGIAFATMWGVVFPLLSELAIGKTITVGAPFYDKVNGPILLALIFLMGIGPMLPWRNATWASFRHALFMPGVITLLVVAAVAVMGVRMPVVLVGVTVCTLVAVGILQEWTRGTIARHRASGAAYPVAFARLMASNRPRYGGYVVHLAIVMLAFGILGSSFYQQETDALLTVGQQATVGNYTVQLTGINVQTFADRTQYTADLNVLKNGKPFTTMAAWNADYPAFNMTATRAAIRSTPVEDLYVIFSEIQPDGKTAAFRILVNPMVWWMWVAGPFLILGTVIALWPAKQRAVAYVPAPAPAGPLPSGGLS